MSKELTIEAPEGMPFIDFTREFDAPVERVFQAHADPELVKQWNGPQSYEMEIAEYDFTTGGRYRYVHRDTQGNEYGFRGIFHTVRENEFVIQTFEYAGVPDEVSIETLTFESLPDGRTRLKGHATYPSLEDRDGMVSSGMEHGMRDGYDKLDALVAG